MPNTLTISMLISGTFKGDDFLHWIAHRADVLSLSGWVRYRDQNSLEVRVTGHQVMVDAMEAACSLGPMNVDVDAIEVETVCAPSQGGSDRPSQFQIL